MLVDLAEENAVLLSIRSKKIDKVVKEEEEEEEKQGTDMIWIIEAA